MGGGGAQGRATLQAKKLASLKPFIPGMGSGHSEHPRPGDRGRTGFEKTPLLDQRWSKSEGL